MKFLRINFFLSAACLIFCSCFSTLKTAKITPVGTNSHTLGASAFTSGPSIEMAGSLYYCFRRGITEKLEIGFDADLASLSLGIGAKYKLVKSVAVDMNLQMSYFLTSFYWRTKHNVPNGNISLIFGENKLYGGFKYCAIADASQLTNKEGVIYPFIGYAIPAGLKLKIIPELALSFFEVNYDNHNDQIFKFNPLSSTFGIFFALGVAF
jgi:hypothetical protein